MSGSGPVATITGSFCEPSVKKIKYLLLFSKLSQYTLL